MKTAAQWRESLRAELKDAMRARNTEDMSRIREFLSAIDQAEAVDLSAAPATQDGVIAGGVAGLGAGDVPRKQLTPEEVQKVLDAVVEERRLAGK